MPSNVELDVARLRALLDSRFRGSVAELQAAWESIPGAGKAAAPDDGTVYRWFKEKRFPHKDTLLMLCRVLDVDPVCLLVASDGDIAAGVEHLVSAFQTDQWKRPALKFMTDFFGRQHTWPPPAFAREHFGRGWFTRDFTHDASIDRNYDAALELIGSRTVYANRPQVHHFGFRMPGYFKDRWLEYGIVERYGNNVRLVHINGHTDGYEAAGASAPSTVMTWFGPGDAVFRVASLHEFDLRLIGRIEDDRPRVSFPG